MSQSANKPVVRTDIVFAEKDKALREDVRRLGQLVGQLVEEQGGEALFDLVEAARRAAIAHREGDEKAGDRLHELITELAPQTAADFVRAFSTYFQMVNTAEKVHRIRRRRSYLRDSSKPQPYGVLDTLYRLQAMGVQRDEILHALERVLLVPVFTTHATEVTRATLLRKQHSIANRLVQMLDPYLTQQETNSLLGQIRLDMTTGWQTQDHTDIPELSDEREHVLFFLTDVIYRIVPAFYEGVEAAIEEVFAEDARRFRVPILVRFGSWIGGDMDGHPDVTGRVVRETLARHRALILNLYHNECQDLARHLSQTESRVDVSKELRERIDFYKAHFPKAAHSVPSRHRRMPYRVFLRLVAARLSATFDDAAFPYESPDEFQADIDLIGQSLRTNRGRHAGLFVLNRLLRRVETFGFHMATLDIRQHADVHGRVVAEGLGEASWEQFTSARATVRIKEALNRRESPATSLSSESRRTLAVFQSIAQCRRKYGQRSIGPYIVSGVTGPEDVLSTLLLARWAHLGPKNQDVPLDIAPLFDRVGDIDTVAEIMKRLLADERYRKHLRGRGDRQIVMVGYADGNLDAGVVSACWDLQKAQQVIRETASEFGVAVTIFHGRGGTISRAGRRIRDAIVATASDSVSSPLRMTETGERISAKYGLRGIGVRTLEQTVGGLLEVAAAPPKADDRAGEWASIMQTVADRSREAYQSLVDFSGDFGKYFNLATPIDVIEKLDLVSDRQPAGTVDQGQTSSRRWEYAWVQNRCLMPAWFGFGSGIEAAIGKHGEEAVRSMATDWAFARVLIADIELSIAKTDIGIARRYSMLAGPLHDRFFPLISDEYQRSVNSLLRLTGQEKLLGSAPTLRRAIRLRNPYVDPMSFLQVDLLRRWREAGCKEDSVLKALRASINGIAHGMQNTG